MKTKGVKRAFLAALALCLAALVCMCLRGRTLRRMEAEIRYTRQNESLYLELGDGGILYVGGQGKLYESDMLVLIGGEECKPDVTDIVIGDEIDEIGYGAIDDYENLQTLKLGKSVKRADNGSVRQCPALKAVYLPRSLNRVGRDFLYENDRCVVVTEGSMKELPRLRHVKKGNIYANIDSFEALVAACGDGDALPPAVQSWWP